MKVDKTLMRRSRIYPEQVKNILKVGRSQSITDRGDIAYEIRRIGSRGLGKRHSIYAVGSMALSLGVGIAAVGLDDLTYHQWTSFFKIPAFAASFGSLANLFYLGYSLTSQDETNTYRETRRSIDQNKLLTN